MRIPRVRVTIRSLIVAVAVALVALVVGVCTGFIRPPRPMFHETYAAGGFGLVPMWQPGTPIVDDRGQWLYVDGEDNLIVVQATGAPRTARSAAMTAGTRAARFRLGDNDGEMREGHFVRIPRMRDRLVVILPDGGWEAFPIEPGQAARARRDEAGREEPDPDLLGTVGSLLDRRGRERLGKFLEGYKPPSRDRPPV